MINNKSVVVTGAGRGIGRAIASKLSEKGYNVIVNDILDLESTIQECKENGVNAIGIKGDITNDEILQKIKDTVQESKYDLIGVVNNAFSEVRKPFLELTDEDWHSTLENSFMSAVKVSKNLLPIMIKKKKGSIVNIASVHSFGAGLNFSPYDSAKAAMIALTKSIASEFGESGIRANAVAAGLIITERNQDKWQPGTRNLEHVKMAIPVGHPGSTRDIANIVEFLISDEASFISGAAIVADGGMLSLLPETVALNIANKMRRS